MRNFLLIFLATLIPSIAFAAQTSQTMVSTYESLADALLAVKTTETNLVRAILASHRDAAEAAMASGDYATAAEETALFANEGDNAVGGVRKRLLEGGHHHHSDDAATGVYEPGFVIVTAKSKAELLQLATTLRAATSDADRDAAWNTIQRVTSELLATP